MSVVFNFIIVLGILIFFHELGHFIVARLCGVGVEKFSLGFGPRILWKTIGRTEYRVSAIPLGGYVKMIGDEPDAPLPLAPLDGKLTGSSKLECHSPSAGWISMIFAAICLYIFTYLPRSG